MGDFRDPEFEEYLRGNSDVSRAYRQLRGAQLPEHIDKQLTEHARAALPIAHNKLRDFNRPVLNKPSWLAPFTLAASVLLSAALLLSVAFDPHARRNGEDAVRMIPAIAAHGDRPPLHAPPPVSTHAARGNQSVEVVPRLFESRRLFTSDPPNSRDKNVDGAQLPPMPVELIRKDPQEWLARIERLRREGRIDEATREMQEFRKVFPNNTYALR